MANYLLSSYTPKGPVGGWVFAAGLHTPSTATVPRVEGDQILPRATTLPIEVRPFVDEPAPERT